MNKKENSEKKWIYEIKSLAKLIGLILVTVVIMLVFFKGFDAILNEYIYLSYLVLYIASIIFLQYLNTKYSNNVLNKFIAIWAVPLEIVGVLLGIGQPILIVFNTTILFWGILFLIPYLIIESIETIFTITFSTSLSVYTIITVAFIFAISLSEIILQNIVYHLMRIKSSKKIREYKIERVIEYLLNRKNIKFLIYSLYFLYLVYYSINVIQYGASFEGNGNNQAILQSFLTVLAFDSLFQNTKKIKLLPSVIYSKLIESYKNKMKS